MTSTPDGPAPAAVPFAAPAAVQAGVAADLAPAAGTPADPQATKLSRSYVSLLFTGQFALYFAFITPLTYSLAVRVEALEPADKDAVLGMVLGIPSVLVLIGAPLAGILSDRTRSRAGRRRPWLLASVAVATLGMVTIGLATSTSILTIGWSVAYVAYSITGAMIIAHLSDRLPEEQRGTVAGINGAVTQIGPTAGVVVAGTMVGAPVLMFVLPAIIALAGVTVLGLRMQDRSSVDMQPPRGGVRQVLTGFVFNPLRYPDFSWTWVSKGAVYLTFSFQTAYTVYFLGAQLGLDTGQVAGIVALVGGTSVLLIMGAALGSGLLSDRLGRRKPFVAASGVILACGLLVMATSTSTTQYVIGALVNAVGIGVFGSVDQALSLDVLPTDGVENGRFLGILGLSNQIAAAAGPFLAAAIVTAGAGGNYVSLYYIGAVLALLGGLLVLPIRSVR